ncbi:MAG: YceG family protein, partial [Lachnospiraceae bacterium]|nr:YceG family protein [Lachnospiraceae bacterium]
MSLDDFFVEMSKRREKRVYFYRINQTSEEIDRFIYKYYEAARQSGVVIEGRIANPTEGNLAYYGEIMGLDFQLNVGFISASLKRWLPRLGACQREKIACAVYDCLNGLRSAGKTENMLKNAYIKFMCWLYYKFERIVNRLGQDNAPKILYCGSISNYELMLVSILYDAGCDVLLVQPAGDREYLKLDPGSKRSQEYQVSGGKEFPKDFSLRNLCREAEKEKQNK